MPPRSILATAANVGHHIHATLTRPSTTYRSVVGWHQRDFEATVTVKQRWIRAVELHVVSSDHKIGNLGPVLARRKMLTDLKPLSII